MFINNGAALYRSPLVDERLDTSYFPTMRYTISAAVCVVCASSLVLANVPWPEHPRPDFKRQPWSNLNGTWPFDFDPNDVGQKADWFIPGKHEFTRQIVVPFPWESRLSGIANTTNNTIAWYERQMTLPTGAGWDNRDIWLVIGACDWEAHVWINGQLATQHVGGYLPFEVNLSRFAQPGERITITIRASDPTEPQQPTGKQINWYTPNSGIWQTVYIEPRSRTFLRHLRIETNIDKGTATCTGQFDNARSPVKMTLRSPNQQFDPVTVEAQTSPSTPTTAIEATIHINNPQQWSPNAPTLYPIIIELKDDNRVVLDEVESYFGLREITVSQIPERDHTYVHLNNQPIYLRGALHQSFHPDGLYQYPDDLAIRHDYQLTKQAGLNCLRIHVKIPIPRALYWADKVGLLIMQDMPCYWKHTTQAQQWWQEMTQAAIERDFNHPSIFAWCLFNETWGIGDEGYASDRQQWVADMYHRVKKIDPTRLVEDNSPCRADHVVTDINSWHFYINDRSQARDHIMQVINNTYPGSTFNYATGYQQTNAPLITSEYGGIGAHSGDQDVSWSYKFLTNELRLHETLGGYIFTQLCDVEWEHNGLVNDDRSPKTFNYKAWHPGFSLKDINNPDFVAIDAPPLIEFEPGQRRTLPIKISHGSDHQAKSLTLRYRVDWRDRFGKTHEGTWNSQPATWQPFRVVDQPPIALTANHVSGVLGALLVELTDDKTILARNYVNTLIHRDPLPWGQATDADTLVLRFAPIDFAEWTFRTPPPCVENLAANKVDATGTGTIEYHLKLPDKTPLDRITSINILAELSSKATTEKLDWPARKTPHDNPQTDNKKWPTDIHVFLNDIPIAQQTLPDDPADAHGVLSHHQGFQGSYGYLVNQEVKGAQLQQAIQNMDDNPLLRIRWKIPANAKYPGGLNIFGEKLGAYPVTPTVMLKFNGGHDFKNDFRSETRIAVNRLVDTLQSVIPTAENGGHPWQYTIDHPADDWHQPYFDDSQWNTGKAGFGHPKTPNAIVNTRWGTANLWLRTEITIDDTTSFLGGKWRLYHDDDVEIYINGHPTLIRKGFVSQYIEVSLDERAVAAFQPGKNLIAVHCHQQGGSQNLDLGLSILQHPNP